MIYYSVEYGIEHGVVYAQDVVRRFSKVDGTMEGDSGDQGQVAKNFKCIKN